MLVDKHEIEPTGQGFVINRRRSGITGAWSELRYNVYEIESLLPIWKAQVIDHAEMKSLHDGFVRDMEAALQLEKEAAGAV